jgi:hypothetical protein
MFRQYLHYLRCCNSGTTTEPALGATVHQNALGDTDHRKPPGDTNHGLGG